MKRIATVIAALLLMISGGVFAQGSGTTETPPAETTETATEETAPVETTPAQTTPPARREGLGLLETDVMYTVIARDNLDRIGAYFDVRVGCIREKNNLTPGQIIYAGDSLLISGSCPAYDGADTVINPRPNAPGRDGSDGSYVVRPQDTLDELGQRLNISVEALKQENNIVDGRRLEAGQVIAIPRNAPEYGVLPALGSTAATESAPEGAVVYVVQRQETIDGIGARFNKNHYCIIEANAITNVRLVLPGTPLVIPDECGPYTGFDIVPPQG